MSGTMKGTHETGFTLIELLVAMVIAAIVMTSVYSVYYSQQKSYIVQEQVAAMHQNLRAAMTIMEREIRMAGCNPKGNPSSGAGMLTANSDVIRFKEDYRGQNPGDEPDGFANVTQEEDISYYLLNGSLVRDTSPGVSHTSEEIEDMVIAENISSLNFTYWQGDGVSAATGLDDIRFVQIIVTATNEDGSKTETLQTRIHARNLGI